MNYEEIGLKIGLEIHRQLDTGKLFCRCPSLLSDEYEYEVSRILHPAQSEMGEIDSAALLEAEKMNTYIYQTHKDYSCLVECDEEPPLPPDDNAVKTAIEFAMLTNAVIPNKISFMRKLVIDGSNPSGFQRTGIIGLNGHINVGNKNITIDTICLEEVSARKINERKGNVISSLDRLGIPLIEVATAPEISTPEEARDVAKAIGDLLRSTRNVKRGLGTIRQDVNISVHDNKHIEIKGFQDLPTMPDIIKYEIKRQLYLLDISRKLNNILTKDKLTFDPVDVSSVFINTSSDIVSKGIKKGAAVIGMKLAGFSGLIGKENEVGYRLGKELSQHAKVFGFNGIFHGDELPAYGISDSEVNDIKNRLDIGEKDSYVLLMGEKDNIMSAMKDIFVRCLDLFDGIKGEVRKVVNMETVYMRPMSGSSRMYPETDVRSLVVDDVIKEEVRKNLPETLEDTVSRYVDVYGIGKDMAIQIVSRGYDTLLDRLVVRWALENGYDKGGANLYDMRAIRKIVMNDDFTSYLLASESITETASSAARYLLHVISDVKDISLSSYVIDDVFMAYVGGKVAWNVLGDIIREAMKGDFTVQELIKKGNYGNIDDKEMISICKKTVMERKEFVLSRGMGSVGPLMGVVMKELKGRGEGKKVSSILSDVIKDILEGEN